MSYLTFQPGANRMRFITGLVILMTFGCEVKFPRGKIPQIATKDIDSIVVIIYENKFMGVKGTLTVNIPKTEWDNILAFALPDKWTSARPGEIRIGIVTIKYKEKKTVSVTIYWAGKNPCMVTLDDKKFFYAKQNLDAPDGAAGLIRKVIAIRKSISVNENGDIQ